MSFFLPTPTSVVLFTLYHCVLSKSIDTTVLGEEGPIRLVSAVTVIYMYEISHVGRGWFIQRCSYHQEVMLRVVEVAAPRWKVVVEVVELLRSEEAAEVMQMSGLQVDQEHSPEPARNSAGTWRRSWGDVSMNC